MVSVLIVALLGPQTAASQVPEDLVKVGFVYNFMKFVEWPSMPEGDVFRVCGLGRNPLSSNLELLASRTVQGRPIRVEKNPPRDTWESCHVMFIEADENRISEILTAVQQAPVLTISDMPGFIEREGVIGLIRVADQMRFEINPVAAQRGQLRISSQLLNLSLNQPR